VLAEQSPKHALGLCILAQEELGKAMMLIDRLDEAKRMRDGHIIFKKERLTKFFGAVQS